MKFVSEMMMTQNVNIQLVFRGSATTEIAFDLQIGIDRETTADVNEGLLSMQVLFLMHGNPKSELGMRIVV